MTAKDDTLPGRAVASSRSSGKSDGSTPEDDPAAEDFSMIVDATILC